MTSQQVLEFIIAMGMIGAIWAISRRVHLRRRWLACCCVVSLVSVVGIGPRLFNTETGLIGAVSVLLSYLVLPFFGTYLIFGVAEALLRGLELRIAYESDPKTRARWERLVSWARRSRRMWQSD